jgi:hypothetical protein
MRRIFPWIGLLLMLGVLLPVSLADDKDSPKTDSKEKKERDKLVASGKVQGKLVSVDAKQHYLTLEITVPTTKPNPQVQQAIANLQQQLVNARRNRNAQQVANLQIEITKKQAELYKGEPKKLDFEATEEAKVRTMILPMEVDEKGKPRKLTEKEKKALKGQGADAKLEGYTADFEGLKKGQSVKVQLAKSKDKTKAKEKDPEEDGDRYKVSLIVILAEDAKK